MNVREVEYNGGKLGLRASALTPRLYRIKFGRDMIVDLNNLKKNFDKVRKSKEAAAEGAENDTADVIELSVLDLTIFENVAYIMARQYDKTIPATVDEWLDSITAVFTVYEILPAILEMWQLNQQTTSVPAKK